MSSHAIPLLVDGPGSAEFDRAAWRLGRPDAGAVPLALRASIIADALTHTDRLRLE